MKSIHAFVSPSSLNLSRDYLPGYPEQVPGHLLVSGALASPVRSDIDILVSVYGTEQLRGVLGHLVEKGRIGAGARQQAEIILREHDSQPDLFRTL